MVTINDPKPVTLEECERQRLGIPEPSTGKVADENQRSVLQCYDQLKQYQRLPEIRRVRAEAEQRAQRFLRLDKISSKPSADQRKAQLAMKAGTESVITRLRDPHSAEFKDIDFDTITGTVCGYVNARNGFGGYTGFKPFTAAGEGNFTVYIAQSGDSLSDLMWKTLCG
jgi:hypothetical protein